MKPTYRSAAVMAAVFATGLAACGERDAHDDADTVPAAVEAPGATAPADLQGEADAFTAAWNQDDPQVVAQYFTDDAVVRLDDGTTFTGRQQILEEWLSAVPAISNLQTHDDVWEAAGEEYRGSGRYTMTVTMEDGQTEQASGTYDATWVRHGDSWRIRSLSTTADEPAPQP